MYSGNYCNNCLKGDLFPGDVNGELCSFSVVLVWTSGKNALKGMSFRSKTGLCGQSLRKHKSMLSWPQNGRSTSIAFRSKFSISIADLKQFPEL